MRGLACLLLAGIAILAFSSCPAFGDIVNGDFSSPELDGSAGWLAFGYPDGQPLLSLVEVVDGRLHMRTSNTWNWDVVSGAWLLQEDEYSAAAVVQDVPAVGGFWAPAGTTAIEFDADITISNNPVGNSAAGVLFDVNYNGSYAGPDGLLGNGVQTVRVEMPGLIPDVQVGVAGIDFMLATFNMLDVSPPQPGGEEGSFTIMVDAYLDNFKFVPGDDELTNVTIDIRPGTYPNNINMGSNGGIPVAILSTEDFDALQVDPLSVTLADAGIRIRGKGKSLFSTSDVNGDGLLDMILSIETEGLILASDATEALLKGMTYDGLAFQGIDQVRIVPVVLPDDQPAVPEPSSIMLLILGGMSVLRRRRLRGKNGN